MKKLTTLLLIVIFALCVNATPTNTEAINITESTDDNTNTRALGLQFTLIENGTEYEVSRGTATATEIVIPETYNFLPVTRIADNGFRDFSNLRSITIPTGVLSIGSNAFENCWSLSDITLPVGVTSIGNSTFTYCGSLAYITIPEGVIIIGDYAFQSCSSLTSIMIPESMTIIGEGAFQSCVSLTNITIPESITIIGGDAFQSCRSLVIFTLLDSRPVGWSENWNSSNRPVVWSGGDGVLEFTLINNGTAYSVSWGSSIDTVLVIPTTYNSLPVTMIASFAYNNYLTSITIPQGVLIIEGSAFSYCNRLTNVTILASGISIGISAFTGCRLLNSITIPEGVTSISSTAFSNCRSLININIPASVINIGDGAFSGCSSLISTIIPENVTSIGNSAFSDCSSLTSIIIPENVTSIGNSAFSYCSSLTSIIIPENVTSIGNNVFGNCWSLVSITLPESVISIGNGAFQNCWSLTDINIPNNLLTIGMSAFSDCSSLISIIIPDNVTSIGYSAFSDCSSLTSINIPESMAIINENTFQGCINLVNITIHGGVTSIRMSAFNNCSSLSSITIPVSVITIEARAFNGCNSLVIFTMLVSKPDGWSANWNSSDRPVVWGGGNGVLEFSLINNGTAYSVSRGSSIDTVIVIPSTYNSLPVTTIASFANYNTLSSIFIPNSVTSINIGSFFGCYNLSSITVATNNVSYRSEDNCVIQISSNSLIIGCQNSIIPSGVTSIDDLAFSGCSSLTSITIPVGVTSIGSSAFSGCSSLASITIPVGVLTINGSTFRSCSSLDYINIPEGVTSIESEAFYLCSSLASINLPESVTSIESYAFGFCSSLRNIIILEGLANIGSYAFRGCSSLASINIPVSVTNIGVYAFTGCSSLTIITELESKPVGWIDIIWNGGRPVIWGVTTNPVPPSNLISQIKDSTIHIAWAQPTGVYIPNFISYAIYRNGILLAETNITNPSFTDTNIPFGYHTYSVSAIYTTGESEPTNTINVAYATTAYPYNQDFGGNSLPFSWSNNGGWIFSGGYVYTNSDNMLITPLLNIVDTSMLLVYDVWGSTGVNTDYEILVSTGGIYEQSFASVYSGAILGLEHQTRYINLSPYAGENVFVAFRSFGTGGLLFIDNVWVGSLPLTPPPAMQATTPEPLSVSLNWEAPEAEWLLGYKVYRKAGTAEVFTLLHQITETTYTDTAVTAGVGYDYYVTAVYPSGESVATDIIQAMPYNLLPPSIVLATITEGSSITLSWVSPEVIGVTSYKVYRRIIATDEFAILNQTATGEVLTYTDIDVEAGTTYQYCVTAVYPAGESERSNIIFVVFYYLMPPANLVASVTESMAIALSWDAPEAVGLQGYKVYRKSGVEEVFTLLDQTADVAYVDATAILGVEYEYYVTAVYPAGESGQSNVEAVSIAAVYNPVNNLVANIGFNSVSLVWDAPEVLSNSATLSGYKVMRGEAVLTVLEDTVYTDNTAVNGEAYVYSVIAVYANPAGESIAVTANVQMKVFNAPTELVANIGNAQVALEWLEPESHVHSATLAGYSVYRDGVVIVSGVTETIYLDEGLTNGVTYTYYVVAVYTSPVGVSEPSGVVNATPERPNSDSDDVVMPVVTSLSGNYPNPFNPTTTIAFEMASEGQVVIEVYSVKGQLVRSLVNGVRGAGVHKVVWDGHDDSGRSVSSGVYFYRMSCEGYVGVKKMVLLK